MHWFLLWRVESGLVFWGGHVTCCDIITYSSRIISTCAGTRFVLGDDSGWTGSVRVNCVCVSRVGALVSSLMYSSWQLILIVSEWPSCVIAVWRLKIQTQTLYVWGQHCNSSRPSLIFLQSSVSVSRRVWDLWEKETNPKLVYYLSFNTFVFR